MPIHGNLEAELFFLYLPALLKQSDMNFLGNILWLILGGLLTAMLYFVAGLLLCITIIGIPFGVQLFKFGVFSLMPFGHEVTAGTGAVSGCLPIVFNVLWIIFGWWEIAIVHAVFGLLLCITIIGIPFGVQHFKIAGFTLLPFGRTIS